MDYKDFAKEWMNDRSYIVAQTSGSTGNPKEIRLDKDFMRRSAQRTNRFFGISKDSLLHSCLSPEFIAGKMMLVRALEAGCMFSAEKPSNEPQITHPGVERYPDLICVVPSQLDYIVKNKRKFKWLKKILVGGQPLTENQWIEARLSKFEIYESYGMTETASHIALRSIKEKCFRTLPEITVETDARRCLVINLEGHKIVTNDLVRVYTPETFKILGRIDNVIITGGRKVKPEEIEKIINPFMTGREYVIVGRPDEKWGRKITLVVEGEEPLSEQTIKFLSYALTGYKQIREIEYTPKLPRTATGKICRNKV